GTCAYSGKQNGLISSNYVTAWQFPHFRQEFGKTPIPPNRYTYPPFLWITLYIVSVAADGHTICCVWRGVGVSLCLPRHGHFGKRRAGVTFSVEVKSVLFS
ncbi:hypothetical protein Q4R37_17085, partial [Morganella morganii]